MKILIVDDVGYSLRSLGLTLERVGHQVTEARNGEQAIAALNADRMIEAVITDLLMPDMDGVDLFIRAKQLERFDDEGPVELPGFILLTTAEAGRQGTNRQVEKRLELAHDLGFVDVLSKPLNTGALWEALKRIKEDSKVPKVDFGQSIERIKNIINSVVESKDREAVVALIECLKDQDRTLQELMTNEGDA